MMRVSVVTSIAFIIMHRMRWIPKLISLIFLWSAVAAIVVFVEPSLLRDILIPGGYLPFFVILTLALWYTLALVARSAVYGLLLCLTIVLGVILSMLQLMHIGLAGALILTLVIESWYTYHRYEKIREIHEHKNRDTGL